MIQARLELGLQKVLETFDEPALLEGVNILDQNVAEVIADEGVESLLKVELGRQVYFLLAVMSAHCLDRIADFASFYPELL